MALASSSAATLLQHLGHQSVCAERRTFAGPLSGGSRAASVAPVSLQAARCTSGCSAVSRAGLAGVARVAAPLRRAPRGTPARHVCLVRAETSSEVGKEKTPFGYTRKDVLLVGLGILVGGIAIKYGLEFAGVDPLQAGNVVQIVFVLGLMLAYTATYVFRVGNKEMTYVKQLKDYEDAVMQKRLEELPESELEAMLAEIEEEKLRIKERRARKAKNN